jgi:GT2 family glycosyltransferase
MEELLTVVIVNYNRCDDLREALLSVMNQDYPRIEIIVVDNASQDDSRDMLAREFPSVVVLALKENIGMDGYSVGFRCAHGKYIFQMDNDSVMPDAHVLTEVVRRFEEAPARTAVVATRVEECSTDPDIEQLRRRDTRKGPVNTGGFHSGGVGFRKVMLDQVGYYNQDVFLYGSELFLQMKFLAAGYTIMFYPEILMLHKSSNKARLADGLYYKIRNRYWFLRHFATTSEQVCIFPSMLIHDIVYSLFERSLITFFRAIHDGFGPLPDSLRPKLHSQKPDFVGEIVKFGSQFNLSALWRRARLNIKPWIH